MPTPIPSNIIVNADDFGMTQSINKAIVYCYEHGYINSASLMANMPFFDEAVDLIHKNSFIKHVGIHANLTDGKPVSDFDLPEFLDENGNWALDKVNQKYKLINSAAKQAFYKEVCAQIDKALSNKVAIDHLDSHRHVHTLPRFLQLFVQAAEAYKVKLRIAQTHNENNLPTFYYRKYINGIIKKAQVNYSDYFGHVDAFLADRENRAQNTVTEIMLHPYFTSSGELSDHFLKDDIGNWINFLRSR
jgi:predicted glycoside hydrolase/deacetylase ChbG (UPF0249 family)